MPMYNIGARNGSGSSLTADRSTFPAGTAPGALVANLVDPFAGQGLGTTSFTTFGTVPPQLALSGGVIVTGGSMATVDVPYGIGILATSGDDNHKVGERLTFTAAIDSDPYWIASNRLLISNSRVLAGPASQYYGQGIAMISPPYEVRSPRVCFVGWYGASVTGEADLGNDLPYEGCWIEIAGVRTALTVGGSQAFTVPNGGRVWTDANGLVLPANTIFRLMWADNVPDGAYRPSTGPISVPAAAFAAASGGDCGAFGSSSQATLMASGSPANLTPGTALRSAPLLMVARGTPSTPPVLIVGDSIGWGYNHSNAAYGSRPGSRGAFGHIALGLSDDAGGRIAHANFCIPGTQFTDIANGKFDRRAAVVADISYPMATIVSNMGRNTATNVSSSMQATADAQAAWAYLKTLGSRRVVQTTITPHTFAQNDPGGTANHLEWTSSDDTNQVRRNYDGTMIALNGLITGTPANVDAVIDIRPTIESTADSRKWASPGTSFTLTASAAIGATTISLDALPGLGDSLLIEPGSATEKESVIVNAVSGSGPYTVTLKAALTKAHAAGAIAKGQSVDDGLHPTTQGAYALKAAIVTAKQEGKLLPA